MPWFKGSGMKLIFNFRTIFTALTVGAIVYAIRSGQPTGRFLNMPYDFRMPTIDRIKERMWNEDDERIFMPSVFGVGWALNLFQVVEKFRADNAIEETMVEDDDVVLPPPPPQPSP
jgi:uncharacterized membrane protein